MIGKVLGIPPQLFLDGLWSGHLHQEFIALYDLGDLVDRLHLNIRMTIIIVEAIDIKNTQHGVELDTGNRDRGNRLL